MAPINIPSSNDMSVTSGRFSTPLKALKALTQLLIGRLIDESDSSTDHFENRRQSQQAQSEFVVRNTFNSDSIKNLRGFSPTHGTES